MGDLSPRSNLLKVAAPADPNAECISNYSYDPVEKYIDEHRQSPLGGPFLAQMASIANRINNFATPVADWELLKQWDIGAKKEDNGTCTHKYYQNVGIYKSLNSNEGRCVISFASMNMAHLSDWQHNFWASTSEWCGYKQVQAGYAQRAQDFKNGKRFNEFAEFLGNPANCKGGVIAAGHSMGGAIAELVAVCASKGGWPFKVDELYTFGTPGITKGEQMINAVSENGCFKGARIYSKDEYLLDPIPALSQPWGFLHPKIEEWRLRRVSSNVLQVKKFGCSTPHASTNPKLASRAPNMLIHPAVRYVKRLLGFNSLESDCELTVELPDGHGSVWNCTLKPNSLVSSYLQENAVEFDDSIQGEWSGDQ